MTADPSSGRPSRIARIAAIGLACVVAGFLIGWFTRGDGGEATVLPAASAPVTTQASTAATSTAASPPAPPQPPRRDAIRLAVLNGTTIAGFAAQTGARAEALGYPDVATGNAPTRDGPTVVHFRPGKRAAAQRVAQDLGFQTITALPASGAVAEAAPAAADVVVVLGTS